MKDYQIENMKTFRYRLTNIIYHLDELSVSKSLMDRVYHLNSLVTDFEDLNYPISLRDEKNILLSTDETVIENYITSIEQKIYNYSASNINSQIEHVNRMLDLFSRNFSSLLKHVSPYKKLSLSFEKEKIVNFEELNKNIVNLKVLIDMYEEMYEEKEKLYQDEKIKAEKFSREKALNDDAAFFPELVERKKREIEEAINVAVKDIKDKEKQKTIEFALSLINAGIDDDFIIKTTLLSKNEIDFLRNEKR